MIHVGWGGQILRRMTTMGLLMLAALVMFVAPASAHGISYRHHQQAVVGHMSGLTDGSDHHATSPAAAVTVVSADDGSSDPCDDHPGHMPGHAGCCASSHCPPTYGGIAIDAVVLPAPTASSEPRLSIEPVDGIAARPGEKPPRVS
jgi:hypothetical protein